MNGRRIGNLTIGRALELICPFERAMFFPEQSPADWEPYREWLEPDAMDPTNGDLLLPMQSYVVRTSHHTILIDTCVGNDKERPHRPVWHRRTDDTYLNALAAHGIGPGDVDYVMCTHLHGDHVGWNTRREDGRWVPTFPNAKYVFTQKEYDAWDAGIERFPRQVFEDSVLPVMEHGQVALVANDYALDDEVWLEPTPGHTPDHVAIALASRGEQAVMCGDLMHSPVQCLHPEWKAWPDWDPALARQTRRRFMEKYCETDTLICTAHFPLPSAGRFVRAGEGIRLEYDTASW